MGSKTLIRFLLVAMVGFLLIPIGGVSADVVINDDHIVSGSQCVGLDCVNGESFGFDTLRLKENNLRIHFDDTSTSASFPKNDWRIVANDSSNGGASYLAFEDATAGRQVFRVEAGAPANALRVASSGNVGLGTGSPVVELHVLDGDTPTVRLEQDGSSGFTPQTFDIAANETNFFIRDVTNASRLPFRIRPGAPTSSIDVANDGDIGFGVQSPTASLHLQRSNDTAKLLIKDTGTANNHIQIQLEAVKNPLISFVDTDNAVTWNAGQTGNGLFAFNQTTNAGNEVVFDGNGNVTILGTLTTGSSTVYPDYVFDPDYDLWSLDKLAAFIGAEGHLPGIATAEDVAAAGGVNISELQIQLLEKIEELTLYTIQQQEQIDDLEARLAALEAAIAGS